MTGKFISTKNMSLALLSIRYCNQKKKPTTQKTPTNNQTKTLPSKKHPNKNNKKKPKYHTPPQKKINPNLNVCSSLLTAKREKLLF